jgi:hypothetical protein
LEERKEKVLCFNCDGKYTKGHKCGEKKLFYVDCEEEEEQEKEQEASQDENIEYISSKELNPPYHVMHWMELTLLKPSRSKDTSKRKR